MSARPGVVYLVGAVLATRVLMTARSQELIASADAIFHDRLYPARRPRRRPRGERRTHYVGKTPCTAVSQDKISAHLIEARVRGTRARAAQGGDPFVFGRGGEEGEALRAAGVEFEVVPGVTAGVAATAYAGIPVTHRDDASAVAFVTGHEDPEKAETALDWEALARFPGTLVFYMGVKRLGENVAALIAAGRDADEPAAVVERARWTDNSTVLPPSKRSPRLWARGDRRSRIDRRRARGRAPRGPRVARAPPPARRRVVVTRARAQAAGPSQPRCCRAGAEVVELPAIRQAANRRAERFETHRPPLRVCVICLTSPNGVRLLFDAMREAGLDARAFGDFETAAVGDGGSSGGWAGTSGDDDRRDRARNRASAR